MYAIVQAGGKQYKVSSGDTISVDKIEGAIGADVLLDHVLMIVKDDNQVDIGRPVLVDAKIACKITQQTKGKKIIVFKSKRRKGYKCKNGHRQLLTELKVQEIIA